MKKTNQILLPIFIITIITILFAFIFEDKVQLNPTESRRDAFFFTGAMVFFLWLSLIPSNLTMISINTNNTSSSYPVGIILQIVASSLFLLISYLVLGMAFRYNEQLINVYYIISLYGVGVMAFIIGFTLLAFVNYQTITKPLLGWLRRVCSKITSSSLFLSPLIIAMSFGSIVVWIIALLLICLLIMMVIEKIKEG